MTCARELARSVVDPWSYDACIPDGSKGTGKFTVRNAGSLVSGTGTSYGLFLNGDPFNMYAIDSSSALAVTNYPAATLWTAATQATQIVNLYSRLRVVSMGIRAYFTGATMNDPGVLAAYQSTGRNVNSFSGQNLATVTGNMQYYKVAPLRNGIQITWRPDDYEDQGLFFVPAGAVSAYSALVPGPPIIGFQAFGVATGGLSSVYYETVVNFEGTFENTQLMPGGSASVPQTAAEPGWYETVQNLVSNVAPIIDYFGKSLEAMHSPLPVVGVGRGTQKMITM